MIRSVVIVGAGHAGGRLCEMLRAQGYDGALTLIGEEHDEPYERPPLSKDVLLRRAEPGAAKIIAKPLASLAIDHVRGCRATSIDRTARRVSLDDGRALSYERLVLATGVKPRPAPFPGADLSGVHVLHSAADALALREALDRPGHLVVIGGGFIGLEVAAAAMQRGWQVSILERAASCLTRVLPSASVAPITALHAANGVAIHCGVEIEALLGTSRVSMVKLRDGRCFDADLVLLGLGSLPNDGLARTTGIAVNNGVVTDVSTRTSDPFVHAIGDVASQIAFDGKTALRCESVDNAERHAAAAASALLGLAAPPASPPWFWTDQYALNVQIVGLPRAEHNMIVRLDSQQRVTHHFYHADGRITGAVLFNAGRDRRAVARLLSHTRAVDLDRLGDPDCDLRSLAA